MNASQTDKPLNEAHFPFKNIEKDQVYDSIVLRKIELSLREENIPGYDNDDDEAVPKKLVTKFLHDSICQIRLEALYPGVGRFFCNDYATWAIIIYLAEIFYLEFYLNRFDETYDESIVFYLLNLGLKNISNRYLKHDDDIYLILTTVIEDNIEIRNDAIVLMFQRMALSNLSNNVVIEKSYMQGLLDNGEMTDKEMQLLQVMAAASIHNKFPYDSVSELARNTLYDCFNFFLKEDS